MNINSTNVFKAIGGLAVVGFVWFWFVSPESANAAAKANGCLIAFLASIAAYYYSRTNDELKWREDDAVYRRIDDQERDFNYRIEKVWDQVNDLTEKVDGCGSCPVKKK